MGCYYVDFVCHSAKLIVELDGSQHAEPEQIAHEAARSEFLESRDYRVLRFWNVEVVKNRAGIIVAILAAVPPIAAVSTPQFHSL